MLARHVAPEPWRRGSTGDGATGPRLDDWALVERWRRQWAAAAQAWGHDLRVRRSVEDPSERASDVVFARRAGLALDALVQVAGSRWQIEAAFEAANGDGGWDDYAGRKWPAWKRHGPLALLAHACLVVVRPQDAQKGGQQRATSEAISAWSHGRRRHQRRAQFYHDKRRQATLTTAVW